MTYHFLATLSWNVRNRIELILFSETFGVNKSIFTAILHKKFYTII